jgi:hypothetical protein
VDGGVAAGEAANKIYTDKDYHQPSDEYSSAWKMGGIEADAKVDYEIINRLANNGEWPNWFEGNEFKAIRDASRKAP